jgi:DNA-binding Lrp family transcriptional regulator
VVKTEKAIILINTKTQGDKELYKKIKSHSGVVDANMIYGPYDMYASCEDMTTVNIKRLVMEIRNMPGVVSTTTCVVMD